MHIVLASASPRRKTAIARLGLPFEVQASSVSEELDPAWSPEAAVESLAERKARAVQTARSVAEELIVGCDTVVALDGEIIGKAADDQGAFATLEKLRGRTHVVLSGLVVLHSTTGQVESDVVRTNVTMRAYTDEELWEYISTGEPSDKAGSYAVQGLGRQLVETIDGDIDNVIGLPVVNLQELLARFGVYAQQV